MTLQQKSSRKRPEPAKTGRTPHTDAPGSDARLEQAIERYHLAADAFARGNPEAVKVLFAHGDDVTLANPFVGPPVRGWKKVSEALDYASSRFRDGRLARSESVTGFVTSDLATIMELEWWEAKVGTREDVSPFLLRVTTTFRREGDTWKIVHRHADPISTPNTEGPLRAS